MGLKLLEHVLILTHDPEGTRDWFCDNLGFTNGYHPEFSFPVYWLYIGDQDVLHIGKARHSVHQDTYLKTPSALLLSATGLSACAWPIDAGTAPLHETSRQAARDTPQHQIRCCLSTAESSALTSRTKRHGLNQLLHIVQM